MYPEYLSGSPTVMAYDYSTGGYFAPSVYGQQTPTQAAFAVARAAEPILANMPATAPLVAHPVPGYPKQGHVPRFDMPMNKGEWNIKGVGIPTFSPALPRMPGSDWRNFPQPIDGRQLNFQLPQFSAYAGVEDYGATIKDYSKPGWGRSRDVQDGNWRYRQFADGAILILISDSPKLPANTIIKGVPEDPYYKNWVAITGKIGAWDDFKKQRSGDILKATAAGASATADILGKFTQKKKKRKKGAAAPPPPPMVVAEPEAPSIFSGPVPWIIGGVAILGVILLMSGKGSEAPAASRK